jgi:hypothetical protein
MSKFIIIVFVLALSGCLTIKSSKDGNTTGYADRTNDKNEVIKKENIMLNKEKLIKIIKEVMTKSETPGAAVSIFTTGTTGTGSNRNGVRSMHLGIFSVIY